MARKGGLGKGIDKLIPSKITEVPATKDEQDKVFEQSKVMIDIDQIEPNENQPRKLFNEEGLAELSDSIKKHGVLAPLWVHEVEKNGDTYFEIIAGERRWRASKKAGLKEVPVIVMDLDEQELLEISLIENIQREDLNPIEEAIAYKRLIDEFNLKQEQVAERVSKSRAAVTNSMRLLKLDERVQQMVIDEQITTGHARAILAISNKDEQYEFAQKIFNEKWNVRDVEREIKKMQSAETTSDKSKNEIDPKLIAIYDDLQERMKNILGTKVSINPKDNKKGKIEIEYFSQDELDRIMMLFNTISNI